MNKTIYMTYKKNVPEIVFERWKNLNPDYNIEFSLDEECVDFLEQNFNVYVAELFKKIPEGMYKADLWRLCKLYIHGGIYADVDLVPYIDINTLDKNNTFYSCLSINKDTIFQAFMANFSKPKNSLILQFLISFLLNYPIGSSIPALGPTRDIYSCIKYNLDEIDLDSEKVYEINNIKIKVNIGSSETNVKHVDLHYFPDNIEYTINFNKSSYKDSFDAKIENNILKIIRIDEPSGWNHSHSLNICIKSAEKVFLFQEKTENEDWRKAYVELNNKKILDSRDYNYLINKGW